MELDTQKRVLMIAYHYPPCRGSSGVQRTLSFSKHLPARGWNPIVLTANPKAYPEVGMDQLGDIPAAVPVKRAFALDTARAFAFRGRYLNWMALPDRWVSWVFCAVPAGLRLIRKYRPKLLWSTYPISTAHLIGGILHLITKIPWVADFRDPMTEIDPVSKQRWPGDPRLWQARQFVERLTVRNSAGVVFATDGARDLYVDRYPEFADTHWSVIANGFDEESFAAAEHVVQRRNTEDRTLTLLHSGVLYPTPDRDPSEFLAALAILRNRGWISSDTIRIAFRATGHDEHHRRLIRQYGLEDLVFLEPPIPYREALAEMLNVRGLVLLQGHDSNPAIPAKLYEYLRAQRPIFAMVDSAGETAKALRAAGVGTIVPLDSADAIVSGFKSFLDALKKGTAPVADPAVVKRNSREFRAQELARLFDKVAAQVG